MKQRVIKYTTGRMLGDCVEEQESVDETIMPYWHVIGGHDDYTACGHATAEYETEEKNGYPTCPSCIYTVKFYKKIKLQNIEEG